VKRNWPASAQLNEADHQVVREDYSVIEEAGTQIGIFEGALKVDRLTIARAGVVALIIAQSAAMEYYERIVDQLFSRTGSLVEQLEHRGSVPSRTRPLNRFIGEAIGFNFDGSHMADTGLNLSL
jgi:uncharacterized Rmd1/YagE family protein